MIFGPVNYEYRAVFTYPQSGNPEQDTTGFGPWRDSRDEAKEDRPIRPEESFGHRSGLQKRKVGAPEACLDD